MHDNDENDNPYQVGRYSHEAAKALFNEEFTPEYLEMKEKQMPGVTEMMFMAFCHGLRISQQN